jgi:glycosyltransferase involved in cell wall biosynthesis
VVTRGCNLKVLHVLHSIERSGAEVMLVQAAPLFEERGLELHALATGESVGLYAEQMAAAGFTIHHLPLESPLSHLVSFYRLLRRERFDVVHVHTERAFLWYAVVARLAGVRRIVRTVHSVFDFRGPLWVERWLQRHVTCGLLGERAVAPSASVQEAEHRIYGIRCVVIPNWTDSQRFSPARKDGTRAATRVQLGILETSVVFVSVGSCQMVKNHAAVIRALATIVATCPDAHYLHVGSGELGAPEQQLVRDLGLVEKVTFAGQRDDIPELLQASDVFVMPSTREGLGNSCLEAMSCGLPAIASDVAGLRDLVVNGETGYLAQSEDDLACAMAELYHGSSARLRLGRAGRARALTEFSLEKSVASYLRLYRGG